MTIVQRFGSFFTCSTVVAGVEGILDLVVAFRCSTAAGVQRSQVVGADNILLAAEVDNILLAVDQDNNQPADLDRTQAVVATADLAGSARTFAAAAIDLVGSDRKTAAAGIAPLLADEQLSSVEAVVVVDHHIRNISCTNNSSQRTLTNCTSTQKDHYHHQSTC